MLCRDLLAAIVALGLVSAIAFSASYQLVARFANKNVVSLGLGCVGSGLVVLVLEMAVHMRSHPTQAQLIFLFELTAGRLHAGLHIAMHSYGSSSLTMAIHLNRTLTLNILRRSAVKQCP